MLAPTTKELLLELDRADPEDEAALVFEAYANYLETFILMELNK